MTNDDINLFPTQNEIILFTKLYPPYRFMLNQRFGQVPTIELEISASDFTRILRGVIPSVEGIDLKESGVLHFNAENTSFDVVKEPLVALPSEYDLEGMTKEQLIQIRDKINMMIKASDFDSFVVDGEPKTDIQTKI